VFFRDGSPFGHDLVPVVNAVAFNLLVESEDEPVAEIIGNSAAVACCIADHRIGLRYHLYVGPFVKSIHHYARCSAFRKSETELGGPVCRCQFCIYIVVGKINLIIIRSGCLALMGEPAGACVLVDFRRIFHRHYGKLSVIVYPRRRLVGLFQAPYHVGVITVGPSVTHRPCLRRPEIHTPRNCSRRVRIACRKGKVRQGTHKRSHIVCGAVNHPDFIP